MKKNRIIILVVVLLVILMTFGILVKIKRYETSMKHYINIYEPEANVKEIITNATDFSGIAKTLVLAIENDYTFDELALSENFKKKYKSGRDIIKDKEKIESLSSGIEYDNNEPLILVFADERDPMFFDKNCNSHKTREYYFSFKINNVNELDDINLVDYKITDSTSGLELSGD